ncbi:MAG: hypothetical protein V4608_16265 [Bacteroidota bacterium]
MKKIGLLFCAIAFIESTVYDQFTKLFDFNGGESHPVSGKLCLVLF